MNMVSHDSLSRRPAAGFFRTGRRALNLSLLGVLGLCWVSLTACKRSTSAQLSQAAPPDVVMTVVLRLEKQEPAVLWEALPASYQADLRSLVSEFCQRMDPEVYEKAFQVLKKGTQVLKEKREFFYKSPVALSSPMLENMMGDKWNRVVGLFEAITASELASLDTLRKVDPVQFLNTTGHEVMSTLDELRRQFERKPGPSPWQRLAESLDRAKMNFQASGPDRGWLRFSAGQDAKLKDLEFVRVEDRWIPQSMAQTWKDGVVKVRDGLGKLEGPDFKKAKPLLTLALGTVDSAFDSLLKASNQKEFDDTLKSLAAVGGMLKTLQPKPD